MKLSGVLRPAAVAARSKFAFLLFGIAASLLGDTRTNVFTLQGISSEVTGTTNGSVVKPLLAPAGLTGTVNVVGKGSVSYSPSGVSFGLGGQQRSNTAFYQFQGAGASNVFNTGNGQVSFSLTSKYNFAQRLVLPSYNYRFAFQAFDNTQDVFDFSVGASGNHLTFYYKTASIQSAYYSIPAGQEDVMFGAGVTLRVNLVWDGATSYLYFNDKLVNTIAYQPLKVPWSPTSSFAIGGGDMHSYGGGYFSCDDSISNFQVFGPSADVAPPSVFLYAPLPGANLAGVATFLAYATDNASTPSVQFQVDGVNIGGPIAAAPYSTTWNANAVAPGTHTVVAIATDASGNTSSTSAQISVGSAATPPSPTAALTPRFLLHGSAAEIAGLGNNSLVQPAVSFGNLSGSVTVRGSGAAAFASSGSGIKFSPGGQQQADNTAFLYFKGPQVARIFNPAAGEIDFTITSQYNLAERKAPAGQNLRYVMDVLDSTQDVIHVSYGTSGGHLTFYYSTNPNSAFYYSIPAGQEDTTFGKGVTLNVRLVWNGGQNTLYFNGKVVSTHSYSASPIDFGTSSSFTIGGSNSTQWRPGFFACDDFISEVQVLSSPLDVTPPAIAITSPATGTVITGKTHLTVNASSFVGITSVQYQVDALPLGYPVADAPFSMDWQSAAVADGNHTITAIATDANGATAQASVSLTTMNAGGDTMPPSTPTGLVVRPLPGGQAALTWRPATDNVGVGGYLVYRNGALVATVPSLAYSDAGLADGQQYAYQIAAKDAAGNISALSAPWNTVALTAAANIMRVGPGQAYQYPCQALKVATDGSVIEIDAAGKYDGDVCLFRANNLTIRGVNGRAHIDANGAAAYGKGIWVIDGDKTTIENIELSGAVVSDANGAGIRHEGGSMTVRNCYFHDNQDGILSGSNANATILIEFSEFARNGAGDGQSHNLYINKVGKFILQYSYSHDARVGHLVKTRAAENYILYNRLTDENGSASYELDIPVAGRSFVIGNLIEQGPFSPNANTIAYGEESGSGLNPLTDLYVVNNTIVNDLNSPYVSYVWVANAIQQPALLQNNLFMGTGKLTSGAVNMVTNYNGSTSLLTDPVNFNYLPLTNSAASAPGSAPGFGAGYSLAPAYQYVHPAGAQVRPAGYDLGAFQH